MATAVFPGTFDPITNGHVDLVRRAANLFDKLIVAVAANSKKQPTFSLSERVELAQSALIEGLKLNNVEVCGFECLLVDLARDKKASAIVRGLRAVADFEYEFQLATMNHKLAPDIESLFLTPSEENAFLSSGLVREVASLGGDVSQFVPANIQQALVGKYRRI